MKMPETDGEKVYRMIQDDMSDPAIPPDSEEILDYLKEMRPSDVDAQAWAYLTIGASIVYHAMKKESDA